MRVRYDLTARSDHPIGERGRVTVFEFVPRDDHEARAALSPRGGAGYNRR
jgi:hypothetical protein